MVGAAVGAVGRLGRGSCRRLRGGRGRRLGRGLGSRRGRGRGGGRGRDRGRGCRPGRDADHEGHGALVIEGDRQRVVRDLVALRPGQAVCEQVAVRAFGAQGERRDTRVDRQAVPTARLVGARDLVAVRGPVVGLIGVEGDHVPALVLGRDHALERGNLLGDRGQLPVPAGQLVLVVRAARRQDGGQPDGEGDEGQLSHAVAPGARGSGGGHGNGPWLSIPVSPDPACRRIRHTGRSPRGGRTDLRHMRLPRGTTARHRVELPGARSSAVEQGTFNPLVLGSNPSGLTTAPR